MLSTLMVAAPVFAQSPAAIQPIRVMMMADMSGPYQDASGPGSVVAGTMAAEDVGRTVLGRPIEILAGDHKNKADVGLAVARRFYTEQGGDVIVDIGNSAISLAVQDLARSTGKMVIHVGSAHADLYGKACSPTGAMWLYDTASLSRALVQAVTALGLKNWFFISADYAAGNALVEDESRALTGLGGTIKGAVRVPLGTADYSAAILEASVSGADVISVGTFGHDAANLVKESHEFQVKQRVVGPILDIATVQGMGDAATGALTMAEFYWDDTDATRAFAAAFAARYKGYMPTDMQAADYSAVRQYLRAVAASGTTDGVRVMQQMKTMPVDDFYARGSTLREDGRLLNEMLLVEVKPTADRRNDWDVFKIIARVPASQGIRPLAEGNCPMTATAR